MGRTQNLAKNSLILSIGTFLPKLAGFITLPILTGYLSKAEYGTYDLITVMVSLLLPAFTLQIKAAAFRFLLEVRDNEEKQKKIISNIFIVTVPVSILVLLILYFVLAIFLPSLGIAIRLWICGYYLADILVNTARQVSRGIGKNLPYSISAVISALWKMLFAFLFVFYLKKGLLGATIALCLASLCSLIYISIQIKLPRYIALKLFDKKTIRSMINYSWPIVPSDMSLWVMNASDRFIVTGILGITVQAVYAASTKIPSLINLAQSALNLAWQENAAMSSKDKDSDQYYTDMFKTMLSLQAAVFGIVIAAMPVLFKIVIKGDYDEAYYQMPLLCYGIFFSGMAVFLGGIYLAYKETKSVGITTFAAAVINIVVHLSLIHFIGLYAASVSTLVSYMALFFFRAKDVRKFADIRFDIKYFAYLNVFMIAESILCYQRNLICNCINVVLALIVVFVFNKPLVKGTLNAIKRRI